MEHASPETRGELVGGAGLDALTASLQGPHVINVLTVDVEEYYHGYEFTAALGKDGASRLPSRVVPETERLLDVLDARGARGTFFTLGAIAQRYPRLIRGIVARGHEIASHGWDHSLVWRQGPRRFRSDVRRAKHALEQAAGRAVRGYRARRGTTPLRRLRARRSPPRASRMPTPRRRHGASPPPSGAARALRPAERGFPRRGSRPRAAAGA